MLTGLLAIGAWPFRTSGRPAHKPFAARLSRGCALRALAVVLVAGAALFGSHGPAVAQSPALDLSLSADRITEGGTVTATVSATGGTFAVDRTVELTWNGAPLTGGLIQGPGNSSAITLPSGESSVSVALTAPDDATGRVYGPDITANLRATDAGTEIGSAPLRYLDNDGKPQVTVAAAAERVSEGEDIVLTATLSRPTAGAVTVLLTVTDRYSALTGTVPAEFSFAADEPEATVTVRSAGNTAEDGAREVEFALTLGAETAGAVLGTPSSVKVWVDDDDAVPGVPRNVRAAPGAGSATVTWEAPAYTSGGRVDKYQYRQSRNGGITWHPGWIDVDGGGHATEVVVGNLIAGTEYVFEMRAVSNAAGNGAVSARSAATPIADPRWGEEQ
jgi:hypothetical protein